jgi:hypothetical protein
MAKRTFSIETADQPAFPRVGRVLAVGASTHAMTDQIKKFLPASRWDTPDAMTSSPPCIPMSTTSPVLVAANEPLSCNLPHMLRL